MEKKELKNVLQQVNEGDCVKVAFIPQNSSHENGEYRVVSTKRGRGKGGSMMATLMDTEGDTIEVGTIQNEEVLHVVTPDGTLHGYEDLDQVPQEFEKDPQKASELRTQLAYLTERPSNEGTRLRIDSSTYMFDGEWNLKDATKLRGRAPQLKLTLEDPDSGETQDMWTYRHSGLINDVEVVENS